MSNALHVAAKSKYCGSAATAILTMSSEVFSNVVGKYEAQIWSGLINMVERFDAVAFAEVFRTQSSSYLLSGMALAAALGFNSAVTATINKYYPLDTNTVMAKWIYAAIVVVILILAVYILDDPSVKPGTIVAFPQERPIPAEAAPAPDMRAIM